MADNVGDAEPTHNVTGEWWGSRARQHGADALAHGKAWDCACVFCEQARVHGWSPELDKGVYPMIDLAADLLAEQALKACLRLLELRGNQVARKAFDVASEAIFALNRPNDPQRAATVERMFRAMFGADARGERLVMLEIEKAIKAARLLIYSSADPVLRLRGDLTVIAERHRSRGPLPDDAALHEVLTLLDTGKIEVSGAVARVLARMEIGTAKGLSDEVLTKRVSEAFRERDVRDGKKAVTKRKPQPKARKPRQKRRKLKAKRLLQG